MALVTSIAPGRGMIAAVCDALGLSRATWHRRQAAAARSPVVVRPRAKPPRALTTSEHETVIAVLREPQYADLAPAEIYATLLDQGICHCSIRTTYRVLHTHQ